MTKNAEKHAYYKGFRVLEIRDYNRSKWGFTVQIAVDCSLMPNLMWVGADSIEIK